MTLITASYSIHSLLIERAQMADTFSKIYLHLVFGVKFRQSLIDESWEEDLYKYITGIVQKRGHKLLAIGGMPDHIHIFIGLKPVESISDMVREVKKSSTAFIHSNGFCKTKFQWQNGYGVFSYHHDLISTVCRYIENQKEHHRKETFGSEYKALLSEFDIEHDSKRGFDFMN